METLFIADDESSIREGLKYDIDWEALDFSLCGEASNGKDALTGILALQPSLVILDIKMPKMNGIEVIRQAREAGFQGKCIILSAHSSFKYAQEAMKYGVSRYLTKPLNKKALSAAACEIREMLNAEKQQSHRFAPYETKAKKLVLVELFTNTLDTPLSEEALDRFHLRANSYQIVICESFHEHSAMAPYTFADLLRVINRENNIFEHLKIINKEVVLLKGTHGLHKLNDFLKYYKERPIQDGSLMESMFLTYGRPVSAVEDIHFSFEDAYTLLNRRFFYPPDQHALGYEMLSFFSRDNGSTPPPNFLDLSEKSLSDLARNFTDYIQSYNHAQISDTLRKLEIGFSQSMAGIDEIRLFLTDLYLRIKENIHQNYASADIPFMSNSAVIKYIGHQNYLREILQFLSEQFKMMIDAISNPARDAVIFDVLFYIDHNFRDNIKLEAIATLFGYNSAYLGKLFNKVVGENFNSYIDHKRIEYAKELLSEDNWKVYEIAKQAGYKNVDYFHKKFKKYVGQSPAEFRKSVGKKEKSPIPV